MTEFGKRLKQLRKQSGLTQKQLAKKLWVTKATIINYELYERSPSPEILIHLSEIFHVSTDYLLGIEAKKQVVDVTGLDNEEIAFIEMAVSLLKQKKP